MNLHHFVNTQDFARAELLQLIELADTANVLERGRNIVRQGGDQPGVT